jgi:toxin secretion/phage lysis holin
MRGMKGGDCVDERVEFWGKVLIASVVAFFAGLPLALQALLVVQVIDIASGVLAAASRGEVDGSIAGKGVGRKAMVWLVVLGVAVLQPLVGFDFDQALGFDAASAVAAFYALADGLSIVTNAERAGVPVPKFVSRALARE